ncbi:MAG: hypothetical protein Ta2B_31040 [Termitinemataceae bacterium]|nr:MAG: hypothetical protein Ta2B_31040 [Termitinemataceae bacterium]
MKKLMLCVVVLLGLVAGVSADEWYNGWWYGIVYADNMTSEQFEKLTPNLESSGKYTPVAKVPNSMLEVVKHAISDYNLDDGDVFIVTVGRNVSDATTIVLRITGEKQYTYYAFQDK